jgi:hypothetical protein
MTKQLWTAILDTIGAILAIWVGTLVSEKMATMILATWAALQVVLVAFIATTAYTEKAKMEATSRAAEANARIRVAMAYNEAAIAMKAKESVQEQASAPLHQTGGPA